MSNKTPSPNDQRSNVKNPNNPAYKSAQDNRADQLNPNNAATKGAPTPAVPTGRPQAQPPRK